MQEKTDACSKLRKDTQTCRTGCPEENVKPGGHCPFEQEGEDVDLQCNCAG